MRKFIVTIDGKSYSVDVEEVGAADSGERRTIPVSTATPQHSLQKPVANGEKVLSPFPGIINNILVPEGSAVKKDQPILVLEAMKMDNEITAPCDGNVIFHVSKGSNVETNAILAVIG